MKLKSILFFGILFIGGMLHAQTDFRPGYVILPTGDTLNGEIDYRGDLLMATKCRFRAQENEVVYTPEDIIAFRFTDSKYFIAKEINGSKVFLEFLIEGEINIYYMRDDRGDQYFLEKDSTGIIEIPYLEEVRYQGNKSYIYKSKTHSGILKYQMREVPEMAGRIDNIHKPEHRNLVKLAEDYHNAICKDAACIIYEKKVPAVKAGIEMMAGLIDLNSSEGYPDRKYFNAGIIAHFWLPRVSEKLYLRTGLLYFNSDSTDVLFFTQFDPPNVEGAIFKIPLQLEYIYPRGNIRPKAAYGINFYKPFYQSVSFMAGVNLRLDPSTYLGLNFDIDFKPNASVPLIPHTLLSRSILAGLIFKL